jgi:mannose-6-phosphate isomerase
MHLLEATMALAEASGRERFSATVDGIADLAATRFIDPSTGALLEYFTDTLELAPGIEGQIVEPGHCFEWAWLFEGLGAAGRADCLAISDRLTGFARAHGICAARGVGINEVLLDGSVHNSTARLWPQTERIKAAAIRYRRTGDEAEAEEAAAAIRGLARYYDVPSPGLWRDKLREDGSFIEEMAPGSSLYHIACAYGELTT